MAVVERARFVVEDPDEVVAAATACRFCLRTAAAVEVCEDEGDGGLATCHCVACATAADLALTHEQLLRLVLRPPAGMYVVLRSVTS